MQPSHDPRDLAADHLTRARVLASSPVLDAPRLATILRDLATLHELPLVAVTLHLPVDPAEALREVALYVQSARDLLGAALLGRGVWDAAAGEIARLGRRETAKRESGVHRSTVMRLVPRGEASPCGS